MGRTDADLQLAQNTIVDKWNSFDQRACHNPQGCKAPSTGRTKILIRYYQDYGPAHIVFKWSSGADGKDGVVVPSSALFPAANPTGANAVALTTLAKDSCCYPNLAQCTTNKCDPTAATPGVIKPYQYARVGEATDVSRFTYWNGKGVDGTAFFFINRCTEQLFVGPTTNNNNIPNDDNVVVEVTMGTFVDYFKPIPGKNLCDMLMNNNYHMWSATGAPFSFVRPAFYNSQTLLGGSEEDWPVYNIPNDNRRHLPFWGGNGAQGGCCHSYAGENAAWNRGFVMRIFPLLPGLTAPTLTNTLSTTWTRIAWVSGRWNTETGDADKPWNKLVVRGLRDAPEAVNGNVFFVRKCSTFDSAGDQIVVKMCFGPVSGQEKECELYRPTTGSNLCTMLQGRTNHEWSFDGSGKNWVKPEPYNSHCGGSKDWWPKAFCSEEVTDSTTGAKSKKNNCTDTRQFLPFWAGYRGGYGWTDRNGDANTQANVAWGRDYTFSVRKPW